MGGGTRFGLGTGLPVMFPVRAMGSAIPPRPASATTSVASAGALGLIVSLFFRLRLLLLASVIEVAATCLPPTAAFTLFSTKRLVAGETNIGRCEETFGLTDVDGDRASTVLVQGNITLGLMSDEIHDVSKTDEHGLGRNPAPGEHRHLVDKAKVLHTPVLGEIYLDLHS